jgi:hypothetical protein
MSLPFPQQSHFLKSITDLAFFLWFRDKLVVSRTWTVFTEFTDAVGKELGDG